jgi:sugar lactone lactonase YvrE
MKTRIVALAVLLSLLVVPAVVCAQETGATAVVTVIQYNPDAGELPEGIAVDSQGYVYVSISPLGEIRKIAPDGSESVFVTLPPAGEAGSGLVGIGFDSAGDLYAALGTDDPTTSGVYRISPDGSYERLAGTEAIGFPNAVAFDEAGNLYVTGTLVGQVWRVPPGGTAELWLQDDLLAGLNLPDIPFEIPLGANGIAYWDGDLYVANTEKAHVVRVPIAADGSAGSPEVFAAGEALFPLDGIAVDADGNIYADVIGQSAVVRIDQDDASMTTVATAEDGLDFPASLAFGPGFDTLYTTNYAIGPPGGPGPGVVRIDLGPLLPVSGGAALPIQSLVAMTGAAVLVAGVGLELLRRRFR